MATKVGTLKGPVGAKGDTGDTGPGGIGTTGDPGPAGAAGAPGPVAVSTQSGNIAKVGTDGKLWVPSQTPLVAGVGQAGILNQLSGLTTDFVDGTNACQDLGGAVTPIITDVRLRTFNAIGNPNFEIDQRNVGGASSFAVNSSGFPLDRWSLQLTGSTATYSAQQAAIPVIFPSGSSQRCLSANRLRLTLTAQQPSMGVNHLVFLQTAIEGIRWREMYNQPQSLSLLVQSSVAPLTFAVCLRDYGGAAAISQSYVTLCTVTNVGALTLFQIPLPAWPSGYHYSITPGTISTLVGVCIAAGANWITPTPNAFAAGSYIGAAGMSNFSASAVNATFDLCFAQFEPLPVPSPFIELDYLLNMRQCQRYYQKSISYPQKWPISGAWKQIGIWINGSTTVYCDVNYPTAMMASYIPTIADNAGNLNSVYIDGPGTPNQATNGTVTGNYARGFGVITLASAPAATSYTGASVLGQWQVNSGW